MAAEVKHCVVVTALLLLTCSVAVAQDSYADSMQKLIGLFEEALVTDNDSLWALQKTFYNPDSKQSPKQVCLSAFVTVNTIADPYNYACDEPAFVHNGLPPYAGSLWHFNSYYELEQQVADDASDSSELATLMVESGSTGMFYTMDPTFFSIMKTLSSSIALSIPYGPSHGTDAGSQYRYRASTTIDITIYTKLEEMPCWDVAVYALRSVLMWVSFNYSISSSITVVHINCRQNSMHEQK